MNTGVYRIRNIVNGKFYVGSAAKSFAQRWKGHLTDLRGYRHPNAHLQAAWIKYGPESFVFEIVEVCRPEFATAYEQSYIDFWRTLDPSRGYNRAPIAGSCRGMRHSEATRAKMSIDRRGRKHTDEAREKIAAAGRGRKPSAATCQRISEGKRGRKWSPEAVARVKAWRSTWTAEQREKRSASLRGRKCSEDSRAKMSASHIGKSPSAETRAKIGAAARGRVHSDEARRKMREYQNREDVRRRKSEATKGLKRSAETIRRLTEASKRTAEKNRGRKQPPEERERRAAALRGRKRSPAECTAIRIGRNRARHARIAAMYPRDLFDAIAIEAPPQPINTTPISAVTN